ncbi:PREDICTED: uncharacterized protein LOC106808883 [Priapulus caudatus]|uniref:Uncharacterized protein LOC106808883 n=1 Tax=Priapulus caudatus TaxID=37621 RepID=A0ABM1E504_PRICU|nr:PREDICTED: uncharacterized protein LOC106808883 [Priapulus caudatus]
MTKASDTLPSSGSAQTMETTPPRLVPKLIGFNILCAMQIGLGALAILFEALQFSTWRGSIGIFHSRASGIWCGLLWFIVGFVGLFLVPRAYVRVIGNARYVLLLLACVPCILSSIYLLVMSSINASRIDLRAVCRESAPDASCSSVKFAKAFYIMLAILAALELLVAMILMVQCFFAVWVHKKEDKIVLVTPRSHSPAQHGPATPTKHTSGQPVTPIGYYPRYTYNYGPQY